MQIGGPHTGHESLTRECRWQAKSTRRTWRSCRMCAFYRSGTCRVVARPLDSGINGDIDEARAHPWVRPSGLRWTVTKAVTKALFAYG